MIVVYHLTGTATPSETVGIYDTESDTNTQIDEFSSEPTIEVEGSKVLVYTVSSGTVNFDVYDIDTANVTATNVLSGSQASFRSIDFSESFLGVEEDNGFTNPNTLYLYDYNGNSNTVDIEGSLGTFYMSSEYLSYVNPSFIAIYSNVEIFNGSYGNTLDDQNASYKTNNGADSLSYTTSTNFYTATVGSDSTTLRKYEGQLFDSYTETTVQTIPTANQNIRSHSADEYVSLSEVRGSQATDVGESIYETTNYDLVTHVPVDRGPTASKTRQIIRLYDNYILYDDPNAGTAYRPLQLEPISRYNNYPQNTLASAIDLPNPAKYDDISDVIDAYVIKSTLPSP